MKEEEIKKKELTQIRLFMKQCRRQSKVINDCKVKLKILPF